MFRNLSLVALLLIAVAFTAERAAVTGSAFADEPKLFSIISEAKAVPESEASSTASVREAEIAFANGTGILGGRSRIVVPLLDGIEHVAALREIEKRSETDVTWRGRIGDSGDVTITAKNGFVSGLIYGPRGVYEIVPRGGKHMLVEIDQSLFPECGGGVAGEKTDERVAEQASNIVGVDSGDRIDVIVVYTTATKNFFGGDSQAQAFVQQAIDSANTAYLNSRIRQRLRLVHTQEFVYTETSNASTDLSNLRSNASIQALRETHKADLVAEISEVTGVCGIGYLMTAQGGVPNNAFTVTVRSCAVGNLSFAHELGHNMGSHHNPENGGTAIFPYGYGHYINGNYRTVMSYSDPCPSGCTRRPYFSNPAIIFNGLPTGLENTRDNARLINATADWVSNYRYSGSSITLSNLTANGEWLPRTVRRNLTWTSDNITGDVRIDISRDESTSWQTIVASTPNDGSEPITVGGRATRRARVRVVSLVNPAVSDSSVVNISVR